MKQQHFEFTEAMNEVSGYGGEYERICRAAICAGAKWFAEHLNADPIFDLGGEPHNADAEYLASAMRESTYTHDDGRRSRLREALTPSMAETVMHHVFFIAKNGWNAYVRKMSAPFVVVEDEEPSA
jgi:hypothetical protein